MTVTALPTDVLLRSADVMRCFAVNSRTTLNHRIKAGSIPPPDIVQANGRRFWLERTVMEALAQQMSIKRDRPEPKHLAHARRKRCES